MPGGSNRLASSPSSSSSSSSSYTLEHISDIMRTHDKRVRAHSWLGGPGTLPALGCGTSSIGSAT